MRFGQWLGLLALVAALVLLWNLRQTLMTLFASVDFEVSQLPFERPVKVPLIILHMLEVPLDIAGGRIERNCRVGIQRIIRDARTANRIAQRSGVVGRRGTKE